MSPGACERASVRCGEKEGAYGTSLQAKPDQHTPHLQPTSADAWMPVGPTLPEPRAPREPGAPHNMTRLIPQPVAPLPDSTGVTPWAAPGPHADDAPYHQRQPHPAAPTPGNEISCPVCHRAQEASAARTRPGQADHAPGTSQGQRQRPHPPTELPRGRPSPRTRPSVAPCSEALLPATLPGTATEQHMAPRPETATQTASQWTPTHAPTGTCRARRHQTHARSH